MLKLTIFIFLQSSKTRQLYLRTQYKGKYDFLPINSIASGAQIQQTSNVVSHDSNDTTVKMIKSDTITEKQTSDVENDVINADDESDLSVTDFKMLCFFDPISNRQFKCKLRHKISANRSDAWFMYKPTRESLRGHLKNYHNIQRSELSSFTHYSDGTNTITFESLVIFIFCVNHNFILNFLQHYSQPEQDKYTSTISTTKAQVYGLLQFQL